MTPEDYKFLYDLLKKRSGLALTDDKGYLLDGRLLPVAREHGCQTVKALVDKLRTNPQESLLRAITDAMTTNESLFFRDSKPFEYLRKTLLPEYKKIAGKNALRIWSAACSTGQEPYSIAMCLQEEAAAMAGWKYEIVGTDLAQKVVDRAKEGLYSQFEVQRGLPIQLLIKYFAQVPPTSWQIKDVLRSMVNYRLQNLLEDYKSLGKFDLVFCRNVLIYFDEQARGQVVTNIAKTLQPGGHLFLGSTESIIDTQNLFTPVEACRGLYRLK